VSSLAPTSSSPVRERVATLLIRGRDHHLSVRFGEGGSKGEKRE